jgi:hypothetical protein
MPAVIMMNRNIQFSDVHAFDSRLSAHYSPLRKAASPPEPSEPFSLSIRSCSCLSLVRASISCKPAFFFGLDFEAAADFVFSVGPSCLSLRLFAVVGVGSILVASDIWEEGEEWVMRDVVGAKPSRVPDACALRLVLWDDPQTKGATGLLRS